MSKVIGSIITVAFTVVGAIVGGPIGAAIGSMIGSLVSRAIMPKGAGKNRAASSAQVQIGEVPREALVGQGSTAGSLVDAFNYGGKYGTDWEVMVLALFDHRCDALVGFWVNDSYVAFGGDGMVAGYNNQLQVFWRPGTESQTVPSILTANGPGWTANDNGAGVCYVVVAYKADASDAKNPVWPGGRPRFQWIVRGALCYDPRKDSSVGGSGAHRINLPATWEYSDNPIVTRYKWVRGFYACDRVDQPDQLLIGRGLSSVEAPPANVFSRANLCDEIVGGEKRYRVGGAISAAETFIEVEEDFAASCAGTIVQPQGCVEIDPGEARAVVATFTDDDLIVGSRVRWNNGILSTSSDEWINTVVATYIEPTQKWQEHAAPVRRETADIAADRQPRERKLILGFVTWVKQAQRCAEIVRRLGRLPGRGEVTLPPRFCEIEEGDWVQWQSNRRFGGGTRTLQVLSWGSNEKWHHTIQFRQISASVFSDTAPLDDGSIAAPSPVPPAIPAPAIGAWTLTSAYMQGVAGITPALIVSGARDDPAARFVRIEYVQSATPPDAGTVWSDTGISGPDITRREIPVPTGSGYYVAVSYVVDNVSGERRILGPVTALPMLGRGKLFIQATAPTAEESAVDDVWQDADARLWSRRSDIRIGIGATPIGIGPDDLTVVWTPNLLQPIRDGIDEALATALLATEAARLLALDAQATADGKMVTFRQDATPVSEGARDQWFKTDTKKWYIAAVAGANSIGPGQWELTEDGGIGAALLAASNAQDTADGKIATFVSETAPTAEGDGDFWYKPSTAELRRWNATGGTWGDPIVDLTAATVPRQEGPTSDIFTANYQGTLDTGQLPRSYAFKRFRGPTDVSATGTAWTIVSQTGITGVTVTVANGVVTIPAGATIGLTASIVVKSARTGETDIVSTVAITRDDALPPTSGGGGSGTSASTGSFISFSTTSFVDASAPLTVKTGSGGTLTLSAPLNFRTSNTSPAGFFNMELKWQYRAVGGSWADVTGGAAASSSPAEVSFEPPEYYSFKGYVTCNRTQNGLTASADYEVKLVARQTSGTTRDLFLNGTASAVGS